MNAGYSSMSSVNTNSSTLVRVFLAVGMLSLFLGSIYMILEGRRADADQPNKTWFGVAQLIYVILLALVYIGLILLR
jgi:hypothetical protein